MRILLLSCLLATGSSLPATAQLFGDVAKKLDEPVGGFSIAAQLGASLSMPSTDATYQHYYEFSTRPSTSNAFPGFFVNVPLEVSAQYHFGYHFRLGLGVRRLGITLANGNADLGEREYRVSGRATVPFVHADVNFASTNKGGVGLSLQAGKAAIGGGLTNGENGWYVGVPVFYEVGLGPKAALRLVYDNYFLSFDHRNWLGTTEQVHTSVFGMGLAAGLLYRL